MGEATDAASGRRARGAAATRHAILEAAFVEFSDHGLDGARVDAIAARAGTTVRMLYYYFASKHGLYRAVLEHAYAAIRTAESALGLERMPPEAAIRRLAEFVFDYEEANPRFVRLVSIENIHRAAHIARSPTIGALNATVITTIAAILRRGRAEGVFRRDIDPVDVHLLITAFCFFRVSNRYTLATIFAQDPLSPTLGARHRRMLVRSVLAFLRKPGR